MAKKTIINGIHFKTQKAAINHTRSVLLSLEPIGEVTPKNENWDYLNSVISRHPQYGSKRGKGIASIIITRDYCNNIAMFLKRVDGSKIDISWVKCVKGISATSHQNLIAAMRFAVRWQIQKFKENAVLPVFCGICSGVISSSDTPHVDHYIPTFEVLAEDFIKRNSPPPTNFDDDPATNQARFSDLDLEYSERWQAYHKKHAKLRLTHAICNQSRKRKVPNEGKNGHNHPIESPN